MSGAAMAQSGAKGPPRPNMIGDSFFGQDVVPGEVIVRYKSGAVTASRASALAAVGATFKRSLRTSRTDLLRVAPGKEAAAAAALSRDPNVEFAEPNRILHALAKPNDTRFTDLWGLNNTAQAVNGVTGTRDADIDAVEGWEMGRGLGATLRVADIDTGVAMNHPDLSANIFRNPGESGGGKETNGLDDDGNGFIDDFRGWDFINNDNNPTDDNEHGTHVGGTIAGRANNALGVAGVASFKTTAGQWLGPKIVPIKVLNAAGSGSLDAIADGIEYAGTIGAKVANLSLGGAGTSALMDTAIKNNPGVLYVVAAGNDGVNNDTTPHTPCVPASTPDAANKICVAATDSRDLLAGFSNFGVVNVDLAAPGVTILSSVPQNTLFTDTFETPIAGRWVTNDAGQTGAPRWNRTTLFSTSPNNSLTDSPGGTAGAPAQYVANQLNWARNQVAFNLAGGHDCTIDMQAKVDTEQNFDFFVIQASTNAAGPWTTIFSFSGGPAQGSIPGDLSAFDGDPSVFVRFLLDSDGTIQDDGAYVDDVRVKCFPTTFNATAYDFFNGTSMATPHVAGAAAFLRTKFPTATAVQIKDKILRSVDHKAALTGKVVTGGRLNLYKAAAESTAAKVGSQLIFTAGAGQTNNVTVTRFVDAGVPKYRITDPYSTSPTAIQSGSRINAGASCQRVNDNTVKCPVAGITRIVLRGGDLNDTLTASSITIPVTLDGGPGNDTLRGGTRNDTLIGSTGRDRFFGNAGNDIINARNNDADLGFSCGENAGDSDRVNADLTPNDPITASAANCEVVQKL
jgi:subtilisin family serine protease